jgi:magnesium transporter
MTTANLSLALHFLKEQPQAAARQLERESPQKVTDLLSQAPAEVAASTLAVMMPDHASDILSLMSDEQVSRLFFELKSADIATILRHVDDQKRSQYFTLMTPGKNSACQRLLGYPDYTVGAWLETDLLMLTDSMRVQDAILRIRKSTAADLQHCFVVNQQRQLIGPVSIYKLLHASESTLITHLISETSAALNGFTELRSAINLDDWWHRDSMPVVNYDNELIGVIHHHQIRYVLNRKSAQKQQALPHEVLNAYGASVSALLELFSPQTNG